MPKGYLDATIHCYNGGQVTGKKYHTIKNVEAKLLKFEKFARTFPGADYVNYYWSDPPHEFAFRRYLTPKEGQY